MPVIWTNLSVRFVTFIHWLSSKFRCKSCNWYGWWCKVGICIRMQFFRLSSWQPESSFARSVGWKVTRSVVWINWLDNAVGLPQDQNLFFQILCKGKENWVERPVLWRLWPHNVGSSSRWLSRHYLQPFLVHLSSFISSVHGSFYLCTRRILSGLIAQKRSTLLGPAYLIGRFISLWVGVILYCLHPGLVLSSLLSRMEPRYYSRGELTHLWPNHKSSPRCLVTSADP